MFSVAKDVSNGRKNKTSAEETRIVTLQRLWHRWTDPSYDKIENMEADEYRNEAIISYVVNGLPDLNSEKVEADNLQESGEIEAQMEEEACWDDAQNIPILR